MMININIHKVVLNIRYHCHIYIYIYMMCSILVANSENFIVSISLEYIKSILLYNLKNI